MAFGPVDPSLDLPALEARVLERWRATDLAGQVQAARAGGPPWIFYEGPPTANGRPGLHHVWARVFKDLYPRFQTMQGHQVPRKGGWDSHGLPVELEVEKELGLHSKHEIEAFGIAEFNERCRESVTRYVDDWVGADRAIRRLDRHRRRLLDAGQRLHRVGLVAAPADVGEGPALRGPPGDALLRPVRHGAVLARAGPARRRTATSSIRRSSSASPSSDRRDVDLLVWTTTPWTLHLQRRRRRRRRHRLRPRAGRSRWRAGPGRGRGGRGPTLAGARADRGLARARARRLALPPPLRRPRPWRATAAGGRGRLRHHGRRLGHRPPRSGLRRGRRRGRPGGGPRRAEPGRAPTARSTTGSRAGRAGS